MKTGLLETVAYIDAPLVIYRAHEGSWGSTSLDMDLFRDAGGKTFRGGASKSSESQSSSRILIKTSSNVCENSHPTT